jgi:hypothetical protein
VDLGGLLDRRIAWLRTFQDLVHENGSATKDLKNIHPVAFGNNSPLWTLAHRRRWDYGLDFSSHVNRRDRRRSLWPIISSEASMWQVLSELGMVFVIGMIVLTYLVVVVRH